MAIFYLFPSKKFLPISFKIQLLETSPPPPQKKSYKDKICNLLLLYTFCPLCLLVKETAEIETGMAEKSSWDQANMRQKLGLVWRNRKKITQIIKDYFYLPFILLIIVPSLVLKGHGNEADFLGFLQKLVPHRSLTLHFEPFRFWLRIRGDIRNQKTTPRLAESGSRQLSDSASRGVADSPIRRVGESAFECKKENSARRGVANSPIRRVGESSTPRIGESGNRRLSDSPSRGVAMVSLEVAI